MIKLGITSLGLVAITMISTRADISLVERPNLSRTNSFYVNNRAPLKQNYFLALPGGSVHPRGWLLETLKRQRDGLTGHLGEISAWLQKEDNAWLSKDGKGKYGWEEVPYWLRGYIELAYIFNNSKMLQECHTWVEGTIASQRPDGDFGPNQRFEDGTRDYWANMVMLYALESYYERSNDERVLQLMTKYFKYQAGLPDDKLLTHYWQKMRGGDELYSVYWLYNRTGNPELLNFAEKIDRCTANWRMKDNLPNWHNVNIAESFREPGQFYVQSHKDSDLQAAYANFHEVRKRYGQVPGGMFGGDENCRAGYTDPRQAVETCGMVEQMLSDEMLFQISGDSFWADNCEDVAFNSYPAAVMPDFTALRYLTAPNLAISDSKNHSPGLENSGPFLMMNPFSSRCCQHNHSQGWPYFSKSLWMATPDNGLCAALYSACEVSAKVGNGTEITIAEETRYPFEETVRFRITSEKPASFPLYLRVPAWCDSPEVAVNGSRTAAGPKKGKKTDTRKFLRIDRKWKSGDVVALKLPMQVSLRKWEKNHDSVSVDCGPLTFSLKIGEKYERHDSSKTATGDSAWQKGADPNKWPAWEILPTTPWNYGLIVNELNPAESFKVERLDWPANDYPFTVESAPICLKVKAKRIPEWELDRFGLCSVLQDSPVRSEQPVETVSLIPMGAARLRISSFPVIGEGPDAHRWVAARKPKPSPYKITASHCFPNDTVDAVADGLEPSSSSDHDIPRLTWWDHRGTTEWVQYELPQTKSVSSVEVYWFDDSGKGQCRTPKSWRLLYRDGGEWKPVPGVSMPAVGKDQWNQASFPALKVLALRLEAELKDGFSGGILEWRLK